MNERFGVRRSHGAIAQAFGEFGEILIDASAKVR